MDAMSDMVAKDPHATEMALRRKLPAQYWIDYNDLLVGFGQIICQPMSPACCRPVMISSDWSGNRLVGRKSGGRR